MSSMTKRRASRARQKPSQIEVPAEILNQFFDAGELAAFGIASGCCAPTIPEGAFVLIGTKAPLVDGCFVVTEGTSGRQGVMRLLRDPSDWWPTHPEDELVGLIAFEETNPAKRYHLRADHIAAMHRVLAVRHGDEWRVLGAES